MSKPEPGKRELVLYGKITKKHGLSGEVKVHAFGGRPDTLNGVEKIYLNVSGDPSPARFDVSRSAVRGNAAVLKLRGVDTPEDADDLRNLEVSVEKEDLESPGKDEYFWFDLVGLRVRTVSGKSVGEIKELVNGAGHDILVIASRDGTREFLVPFVERFVAEVDMDESVVTISPVQGLLD